MIDVEREQLEIDVAQIVEEAQLLEAAHSGSLTASQSRRLRRTFLDSAQPSSADIENDAILCAAAFEKANTTARINAEQAAHSKPSSVPTSGEVNAA